ncbi:hypothetical protein [Kribbella pratensis]|uniref:hypothetical protein n=1 Tax=Kribbella pratensis TaxID=2512112 RepID=UPI0010663D7E|nr:hypothetical protein [Kribbella pratensis]
MTTWLIYLVLAAVKSRTSRIGAAGAISGVLLATVTFFIRGLAVGTSLDGMLYGAALLSIVILLITGGDPSLMFDIHHMKGKQFRRLSKQERARVKARDRRSGTAQFAFIAIVIVGASLYVGLGWTFLD